MGFIRPPGAKKFHIAEVGKLKEGDGYHGYAICGVIVSRQKVLGAKGVEAGDVCVKCDAILKKSAGKKA